MGQLLYNIYNNPFFWPIVIVWALGALAMSSRWKPLMKRTQKILPKPIIFIEDEEPDNVDSYPRSLFEQLANGFRSFFTELISQFLKVYSKFIASQHPMIFDKEHMFRTVGYILLFVALFLFVLADTIVVSGTLQLLNIVLTDLPPILQKYDLAMLGGSLLALVVGGLLVFESFASPSELTRMSDKSSQEKRVYRAIAMVVILLAIITLISFATSRLVALGQIPSSPGLDLFLNWVLYGIIPINAAICAALIVPDGMRGMMAIFILIEWILYGALHLLNFVISALGSVIPVVLDLIYRLIHIIIDFAFWLLTTPIFMLIKPFEALRDTVTAPDETPSDDA